MVAYNSSFKQSFLRVFFLNLHNGVSKTMTYTERKTAAKFSADAAMVLARGRTYWSGALLANLCKKSNPKYNYHRNNILRRLNRDCLKIRKAKNIRSKPTFYAKSLVKKKIQVLKRLVPGGESMVDVLLIPQALDYITALRAQVEIMRSLIKLYDRT